MNKKLTRTDVKTKDDAVKYARQRKDEAMKTLQKYRKKHENRQDDVLSLSLRYELNICLSRLSTGGDTNGFKLYYTANDYSANDYSLEYGVYYWGDWGQYEEVLLFNDEAKAVNEVYLGGAGAEIVREKAQRA